MALPAIAPYPMPGAGELVDGPAPWTVEPSRAALLIHDMQEHFVGAFERGHEPIPELIANISRLRNRAHDLGIPVIYSAQPPGQSREQRGLLQDFWGDGIGTDPARAAIIPELAPGPRDLQLTKWRYSAFVRTNLHDELRAHGRDQLLITGIYAHIGCLMTAAQAFMEEVEPFLVADAVADFSRDEHDQALAWAAKRCAATPTTDALLRGLSAGGGAAAGASGIAGAAEAATGAARAAGVVRLAEGAVWASEPSAAAAIPADVAALRLQLAELTDDPLGDIGEDDDLSDVGIDSIRLMGLITRWNAAGRAVTFEELAEEPTLAAWAALLERPSPTRA